MHIYLEDLLLQYNSYLVDCLEDKLVIVTGEPAQSARLHMHMPTPEHTYCTLCEPGRADKASVVMSPPWMEGHATTTGTHWSGGMCIHLTDRRGRLKMGGS